jgi:hypothetical protein
MKEFFQISITFGFTVFAWIFFRAENMHHALNYVSKIFSSSLFSNPYFPGIGLAISTICLTIGFVIVEWIGRESQYATQNFMFNWPRPVRWTAYGAIVIFIIVFSGGEQQFIYFQF